MPEVVPAFSQRFSDLTYLVKLPGWMDNLAKNLPHVRDGLNLQEFPKFGKPCLCIGAGPSLARHRHLSLIKKAGWKHPVFCCDRELRNCLKHGIIPNIVASVDGSPVIAKFYKHKLVRKHANKIDAAFNIMVHPNTVKAWKGKVYWFTAMVDSVTKKDGSSNYQAVTFALHLLSKGKGIISGVGNVGSFLWNLAAELECSPIILVGYDFSEQVKLKNHAVYFGSFVKMFLKDFEGDIEKAMEKAATLHQVEKNPDFNRFYLVNPVWKRYRDYLAAHILTSKIHTINATGNGCIHTEAIPCKNFEAKDLKETLSRYN